MRLGWPDVRHGRARLLGEVLLCAAAIAYVAVSMHLPVSVLDFAYDDGWFYERARFLAHGQWLGPYSSMTLIKGPGYIVFLALNHALGLPVTLSHALLQLGACAVFAKGAQRISGSSVLAGAVFLASLWHPYLFSTRVIRDAIYAPQTLLFLGCLMNLVGPGPSRRWVWAIGAGLSFTWLWLTREEGIWIVPGAAVLCLAAAWRDRSRLWDIGRMALVVGCAFLALAACTFAAYRTWSIVEFTSGPYSRAVNALQRVRVGPPVAYVPVPAKVRAQVYAVSPSFAALRPYFDGYGRHWIPIGCQVYPSTCDDYAGGWFIWALREGVERLGDYRSPADANRFYKALAAEVAAGCRSGRLTCAHTLVDYLPQITPDQWRTLPGKLRDLAGLVLARAPNDRSNSFGDPASLQAMWDFIGYPRRTPTAEEAGATVVGWFYAPPAEWLQARCGSAVTAVPRIPSPDIAAHYHDPMAAQDRFNMRFPGVQDCTLQRAGAGPGAAGVHLDGHSLGNNTLDGHPMFIDEQSRVGDTTDRRFALRLMDKLIGLYRILIPALLIAAAVAYLVRWVQLLRGRARFDLYWWTVHALWLMVVTRCVVLLLVDISSFPGLTMAYLTPVFVLVVSATILTIGLPFPLPRKAAAPDA